MVPQIPDKVVKIVTASATSLPFSDTASELLALLAANVRGIGVERYAM